MPTLRIFIKAPCCNLRDLAALSNHMTLPCIGVIALVVQSCSDWWCDSEYHDLFR